MVDGKGLLDASLGAVSTGGQPGQAETGGLGDLLGQVLGSGGATGSSGGLFGAIKDAVGNNPGLAQAAAIGLGGLLFGSGKARGVASGVAKLGGAALIGGLAYKALKRFQGVQPDASAEVPITVPEPEHYKPVATTNEGALKLVRTMIAAAMADGTLDQAEQQRIVGQMS